MIMDPNIGKPQVTVVLTKEGKAVVIRHSNLPVGQAVTLVGPSAMEAQRKH